MSPTQRAAMEQALEALEWWCNDLLQGRNAADALRAALAEQPAEQEKLAIMQRIVDSNTGFIRNPTTPQPAKPAQAVVQVPPNNDLELLLRQVFAFCEATEDATEVEPKNEHQRGFDKGRRFEAKQIRRSIGDWFQAEFCGRSFMGEPVVAAAPEAPQPAKPAEQGPPIAIVVDAYDTPGLQWLCQAPPSRGTRLFLQPPSSMRIKKIHPLDVPLEVFLADLTTRPANVIRLEMRGLFDGEPLTVRHLCMIGRAEMKRWPNFGKKCLNEVEELLRARGLQLWENHDERSLRLLREHKEYFK